MPKKAGRFDRDTLNKGYQLEQCVSKCKNPNEKKNRQRRKNS
jgi:hypothetical protein